MTCFRLVSSGNTNGQWGCVARERWRKKISPYQGKKFTTLKSAPKCCSHHFNFPVHRNSQSFSLRVSQNLFDLEKLTIPIESMSDRSVCQQMPFKNSWKSWNSPSLCDIPYKLGWNTRPGNAPMAVWKKQNTFGESENHGESHVGLSCTLNTERWTTFGTHAPTAYTIHIHFIFIRCGRVCDA